MSGFADMLQRVKINCSKALLPAVPTSCTLLQHLLPIILLPLGLGKQSVLLASASERLNGSLGITKRRWEVLIVLVGC